MKHGHFSEVDVSVLDTRTLTLCGRPDTDTLQTPDSFGYVLHTYF